MRVPLLGLFLAVLTTGAAAAQDPVQQPSILDCSEFSKSSDEAALVKRFGRENVVSVKLPGAEGETVRGTAIFPRDPARRLEVYWQDEAKRRGLASIAVRGKSEWLVRIPGKARSTLSLKSTLDEIEEANERPFLINGFGWDYGGFGAGWQGGKLDAMRGGGCSFGVRFNPDPKAKDKALHQVSGDRQIASSNAGLRAVKPFLSSITLDWPE